MTLSNYPNNREEEAQSTKVYKNGLSVVIIAKQEIIMIILSINPNISISISMKILLEIELIEMQDAAKLQLSFLGCHWPEAFDVVPSRTQYLTYKLIFFQNSVKNSLIFLLLTGPLSIYHIRTEYSCAGGHILIIHDLCRHLP